MSRLVVLEGARRGAALRLLPDRNRLGRDPEAEVHVPDEGVSRVHAEVSLQSEGGFAVVDAGSKNGTFLNGVRLDGRFPLAHGDELRLGETVLVYLDDDAPEAADGGPPAGGLDTVSVAGPAPSPAAARPREPSRGARPGRRLVGESGAIRRISSLVARCARVDTPVLILGESGTGKELVAESLHRLSPRRAGPFVALNGALLEGALLDSDLFGHERGAFTGAVARRLGKLELARGGTLFLDEVGELPLPSQAKLLRALETRQFQRVGGTETLATDARIVAATNRDLPALVKDGRFREDLLFRLKVVELELPPLRSRLEDLPELVRCFLEELRPRIGSRAKRLSREAMACLERWTWPGNVRELRNVVERALIFAEGDEVEPEDLPAEVRAAEAVAASAPAVAPGQVPAEGLGTLQAIEREHIVRALEATGWNKSRVATILGIDRATLYAKIKRHGIEP